MFLEGDSGAGKTTMLELILKETDPTQGNIQVNGIELAGSENVRFTSTAVI